MFDAKKETERIVDFIRNYYKENNLKGAVLGISGGKDSAVVAALLVKAIGVENVVGITMSCESKEEDKTDAKIVADKYGFELINIDLTETYHAFKKQIHDLNVDEKMLVDSDINIKPRLRMSANYYVAAMYTHIKGAPYIVAGTSNKCELYVGYFTKGGDSTYDIGVLNNLTVDEVIAVGEYLEVPDAVLHKTPSDGLSGKSDEDKLGVKYKDIAKYMNGEELEEETKEKIARLHRNAHHKFNIPVYNK